MVGCDSGDRKIYKVEIYNKIYNKIYLYSPTEIYNSPKYSYVFVCL